MKKINETKFCISLWLLKFYVCSYPSSFLSRVVKYKIQLYLYKAITKMNFWWIVLIRIKEDQDILVLLRRHGIILRLTRMYCFIILTCFLSLSTAGLDKITNDITNYYVNSSKCNFLRFYSVTKKGLIVIFIFNLFVCTLCHVTGSMIRTNKRRNN